MSVDITTVEGVALVSLVGDIDLQNSPRIRKALLQCLSEKKDVLVDLGGVTYIDSSGVASLVEAFQNARRGGSRFGLVGVSPAALRVLQLARLDKVFAIYGTLQEALGAKG